MHKISTEYPDLTSLDNTIPEIMALQNSGQHLFFDNRSMIYSLRKPSEVIYQVIDGIVIKSINGRENKRQILDFKFKNSMFGFTGHSTLNLQTEAIGKVHLIQYPLWALNDALRVSPKLVMQINSVLMRDIELARYHTFTVGKCDAHQAVARFLIDLSLTQTETPAQTPLIRIDMRRSDIADYLGVTTETVSRTLSRLRADGTIAYSTPNHVEVLDWNKLQAVGFPTLH